MGECCVEFPVGLMSHHHYNIATVSVCFVKDIAPAEIDVSAYLFAGTCVCPDSLYNHVAQRVVETFGHLLYTLVIHLWERTGDICDYHVVSVSEYLVYQDVQKIRYEVMYPQWQPRKEGKDNHYQTIQNFIHNHLSQQTKLMKFIVLHPFIDKF